MAFNYLIVKTNIEGLKKSNLLQFSIVKFETYRLFFVQITAN